ncbi:ribosome biogenesis GTPase Der [Candidatus Marinamargulisbacteria bacterium SCGC AG-439-L15]|nr:ribosome biogenesis GTPase Der [Candidatus Marinamargulisbacteria bacterium SCGC AG-439-L15]
MKKLPKVLILGRPNVGKSTLINRLTGTKKAITAYESGVTRDIRSFPITWNGKEFLLLDSGGLILDKTTGALQKEIERFVKKHMDSVQKILFLVDYETGLTPIEDKIVKLLRPFSKKVVLAVNKVDDPKKKNDLGDFHKLGLGTPFPVSSLQGIGTGDLLDQLVETLQDKDIVEETLEDTYRVAIVGRPNVGKSSLLNALVNEDRVIVDNQAGTTRDSVEVYFEHQDHKYMFIDTAGIRRRAKIKDSIEYFSVLRSDKSLETADLVIVVLDAELLLSEQDKRIIQLVITNKRNMIILMNKWDLTEKTDQIRKDIIQICQNDMPSLLHYPILFSSALERHGLGKIFDSIPMIIKQSERRITTGELNRFVTTVIGKNPPPSKGGKPLKVYYVTQAETAPPTFVFFVNQVKLITPQYRRFIEKRLRTFLGGFEGCGMRIKFKGRQKS